MYAKLLFVLTVLFPLIVAAQITEEPRGMNAGMQNALVLELPDSEERLVKKWWQTYMKDHGARPKKVKGSDELLSEGAGVSGLGGSVNVYNRLNQVGQTTYNVVWFDQGADGYLNSADNPAAYTEAEKFLMRFALFVTEEKIKLELAAEEKEMKMLLNDLSKLERENASYHREIEQAKERIARAEANIITNLENQKKAKADIENQQEVVEDVKRRLSEM